MSEFKNSIASLLLSKKYWFAHFWVVSIISIAGLLYMGGETYTGAPPVPNFKSANDEVIISADDIEAGQNSFIHAA